MQIGIGLPNQVRDVRADIIPEWAVQAEQAGFSSLGTIGRIAYPGVMDTVALAAAAGATQTIRLITDILLAPVWPPVLLAKEVASLDGVSGGRLTLGVGLGGRPDDFVVEGLEAKGLGKRLDHDLEVYRSVWRGEPVGGGPNPAVTAGTREVPLLFGGTAPASYERMARWGEGYIAGSLPPAMLVEPFEASKKAWRDAGREGTPRLVAIAYFAFGDIDKGRNNVRDYYSVFGADTANMIASGLRGGPEEVRTAIREFIDIGTDELIFVPTLDDVAEVARLAEVTV